MTTVSKMSSSRSDYYMSSIEHEFVTLCLMSRRAKEVGASAQLLASRSDFDWSQVLRIAAQNRVSALLYDAPLNWERIPENIKLELGNQYDQTACQNLLLLHECTTQCEFLDSAGLPPIALKGVALIASVYRNLGLRPMTDADILVRKEDAPEVLQQLASRGYQMDIEPRVGTALKYENEISLHRSGQETVRLDIHWSLFDSIFYQQVLSLDWLWQTSQIEASGNHTLRVLGPEAQLIYLCGHIALHHPVYPRLLWLNDLFEVSSAYQSEIDWDLLLRKSAEMALILPVRDYLTQIAMEWKAPVPLTVIEDLKKLSVSDAERKTNRRHAAKRAGSLSSRVLPDLLELPLTGRNVRFILTKLFPSPTYLQNRYRPPHPVVVPLLYCYHVAAGLAAALSGVVKETWGVVRRLVSNRWINRYDS